MFMFKKLITPFLVPPGIFIATLFGSALWFLFRRNRKAGLVNLTIGGLMWIFSTGPIGNAFLIPLERAYKIPSNVQGDVIVLLGAGVYSGAPDLTGIGVPSENALSRLFTVARLQKYLNIPVIISGGKVFDHNTAEAPILKRFLVDLGIPSDKIVLENKSRDTIENAKYTLEICESLGYKKLILVTSAFHMNRAVQSFKKVGKNVIPFPANFKTWKNQRYGWSDYLPRSFKAVSVGMKEYLGHLFYQIAY